MTASFVLNARTEIRKTAAVIPEQTLYLPYDIRTELKWLDFSGPSNPLGTPPSFLKAMHTALVDGGLEFSPDREARKLRSILARRYELKPESFLCGTSINEMIRCAAQTFQPCVVGICVPTMPGYLNAIFNAGHKVIELSDPHTFVVPDASTARRNRTQFDAAVLANPTYPTSRLLSKATLVSYLESCKWVIVDESLIELTLGGESMVSLTERYRNLIIVRSLVHSFAMPGVPISYCVAHPETIVSMHNCFDCSGISMFAEVIAEIAGSEEEHIENARELLETEIPWMQCMLNLIPGIHIFPAEGNFVMCSYEKGEATDLAVANTEELVSRLQVAGFLVKKLKGMPGITNGKYFCVAVRKREENEKLLRALREIILP
ncbi:MAG: aminotransferase class I/II-fold pyridoxal phosphate-dependent enzyme [Coriobacteriaceae bacterium]|jgi:threonine-phosphate decarboxylase|nr:aminotransferase class I/II-fold pyridoxal phosphate-dependent enzyme [Coriobacteriaceae bacterium]